MRTAVVQGVFGLCLASVGLAGPAQDGPRERLEAAVPGLMARVHVPAVAVALASSEGVTWSRTWGERQAGQPAGADTLFAAASLTKPVVAYAVLKLVGEGVLELDAPLAEVAPLADLAHDPRHARLTARMVLDHTTGLPNWRPSAQRLDFEADPGERWGYSGEGFVLLARVLEELTGATLETLARELVFEPLGMTRSSLVCAPALEDLALPHDEDGVTQPRPRPAVNAAASLVCTASDYARFLSALLRGEGLDPALVAEMRRPQAQVDPGVAWGLGMGIEEQPEGPALWQWGHNDGYRGFAWLSPARDLAFVYLGNGDEGMLILRDLLRAATGVESHPALEHLGYPSWDDAERAAPAGEEASGEGEGDRQG